MTRICHLFDRDAGWEQCRSLSQLLDRLPSDRFTSSLAAIDSSAVDLLRSFGRRVAVLGRRGWPDVVAAPALSRFLERNDIDMIHAWGARAAHCARAATKKPIVVELFDPVLASRDTKLIRTIAQPAGLAVVCSCEIVRRRLIEGGVPPDLTLVIRPGVDFARINTYRRSGLRKELGLGRDDTVILAPAPAGVDDGLFDVLRAAGMLNSLTLNVRLILPGRSRSQRRIVRLDHALPIPPTVVSPGDGFSMEPLIAISDMLVTASRGDLSTTCIAWAMASETAVIGSAVHAVAEMIAHKVNGLLFKPVSGKSMVVSIAKLLQDRESQAKTKEVARGQAYEIFGLRRYVDQHGDLYENVLSGKSPADGITDPARTG